MNKCYSELIQLPTFQERFDYLVIGNGVGYANFGWRRYLNQALYHSPEWKQFRDRIIIRDNGRDLACEGYEILSRSSFIIESDHIREYLKSRSVHLCNGECSLCS